MTFDNMQIKLCKFDHWRKRAIRKQQDEINNAKQWNAINICPIFQTQENSTK